MNHINLLTEFWTVSERKMNKPNQKKKVIVIAAAAVIVLLCAVAYILISNINTEDFYQTASEIDYDTASGFYKQAETKMPELFHKIKNKKTALSFLKRSEKLSSLTGNWRDLSGYAADLAGRYRNNLEITAIYAYALLMNENYHDAVATSKQKLGRSEYNSIYLASSVKAGEEIRDSKNFEKIPEKYKLFFSGKSPALEDLLKAAGTIKDDRLIVDAALIHMKNGEGERAIEIMNNLQEPFPEIGMFIAYDQRDWKRAAAYFNDVDTGKEQPEIMMFGADIMMKIGSSESASEIYKTIITDQADYSWMPYRNLYSLEEDEQTAVSWLESGLKMFPEQEELLLPLAWERYLKTGNTDDERFKPILNTDKNSELSELFRINTLLSGRSPEHIIGNYWNIFNRAPDSETIATAFANYLLRNKSFQQLDMLINKYTAENGDSAWADGYAAVSLAMQGYNEDALSRIKAALEKDESAELLFNMAVINDLCRAGGDTLGWLEKAAFAAEKEENKDDLAAVYFKTAEAYYNKSEYRIASDYIKKTLRLNPDDIRSSLLLKKIEEGYND